MTSRQNMKADARKSAKFAPAADPDVAKDAIAQAKGTLKSGSKVQPVYKTQDKIAGENTHRDKDAIISEFDDPAAHKV